MDLLQFGRGKAGFGIPLVLADLIRDRELFE
jgi:hypothetical protein